MKAGLIAFGAVLLASCGRAPSNAALPADEARAAVPDNAELIARNPAGACASPETMDGLKGTILQNLAKARRPLAVAEDVRTQFEQGLIFSVDSPTLQNFDPVTKKVTCEANVTITYPGPIIARIKLWDARSNWSGLSRNSEYSIQPAADGRGLVYTLKGYLAYEALEFAGGMMMALDSANEQLAARAGAPAVSSPAGSDTPADSPRS